MVRFGRGVSRWFKTREQAERFLTGLRYETDKGSFDLRDYAPGRPLAVENLVEQYLRLKQQQVKPSSFANYKRYLNRATDAWQGRNIKTVVSGDIEDFLWTLKVSEKTRADVRSCLHAFFAWAYRREYIEKMPTFPSISFELGYRNLIDIETQGAIIAEIERISAHISPKIAMGVRFLATYVSIRPAEMLAIREGHIDLGAGFIVIPHPKERKPKLVPLLDEDVQTLSEMPRGLPDLYFFRHDRTANGAVAGQPFGKRMFYKWWKRACDNLGIDGVDLYAGCKHSTVTSLGKLLSPEQIRCGTMHQTNKAFERYYQRKVQDAMTVYQEARVIQRTYNQKKQGEKAKVVKLK